MGVRTSAKPNKRSVPDHIDVLRHVNECVSLTRVSDAVLVFTNACFERMFGYGPDELLGQHVSILNAVDATDPMGVAAEIITALRADGCWDGELCNRRQNGSIFWSHASISTYDHPEFGPVWVTVQRDISRRKELEEQLLRAKSFLDSIVQNIPDMVFVKDAQDLRFVLVNRAGEELLGYGRADLIGKKDYDFFPKAEADSFTATDRAVLRDKTLLDIPEEPIATAKHGVRLLHTKKIPILDDKGAPTYLLGVSEDVTERHEADELRRRRELATAAVNTILRALNTHIDVAVAFADVCAGLRDVAQCASASLALFDERREWVRLVAAAAPWPAGGAEDVRMRVSDYPGGTELVAGRPYEVPDLASLAHLPVAHHTRALGLRSRLSLPLFAADGVIGCLTLLWADVGGCATVDKMLLAQVTTALAIAMERQRLFEQVRVGHERLAVLSRRLLAVQETERRHLARELHDEIGQHLTGIGLQLSQLEPESGIDFRARVADACRLVAELIDRIRALSLDLRPAMLDDFGLLPALRWLFERFFRQVAITVAFEPIRLEQRFSPDIETAAYRIVQESLTNVARHANVSTVAVRAFAADGRLIVEVEDHGTGFDAEGERTSATTSGLSGMRERAALLGGRLTIESVPGAGTRIRAEFHDS
jgi:PAS domain S-box-containing protein